LPSSGIELLVSRAPFHLKSKSNCSSCGWDDDDSNAETNGKQVTLPGFAGTFTILVP